MMSISEEEDYIKARSFMLVVRYLLDEGDLIDGADTYHRYCEKYLLNPEYSRATRLELLKKFVTEWEELARFGELPGKHDPLENMQKFADGFDAFAFMSPDLITKSRLELIPVLSYKQADSFVTTSAEETELIVHTARLLTEAIEKHEEILRWKKKGKTDIEHMRKISEKSLEWAKTYARPTGKTQNPLVTIDIQESMGKFLTRLARLRQEDIVTSSFFATEKLVVFEKITDDNGNPLTYAVLPSGEIVASLPEVGKAFERAVKEDEVKQEDMRRDYIAPLQSMGFSI